STTVTGMNGCVVPDVLGVGMMGLALDEKDFSCRCVPAEVGRFLPVILGSGGEYPIVLSDITGPFEHPLNCRRYAYDCQIGFAFCFVAAPHHAGSLQCHAVGPSRMPEINRFLGGRVRGKKVVAAAIDRRR